MNLEEHINDTAKEEEVLIDYMLHQRFQCFSNYVDEHVIKELL